MRKKKIKLNFIIQFNFAVIYILFLNAVEREFENTKCRQFVSMLWHVI